MESERKKLERHINTLMWHRERAHADALQTPILDEIIAEKRAALAALDGPAEGVILAYYGCEDGTGKAFDREKATEPGDCETCVGTGHSRWLVTCPDCHGTGKRKGGE